MPILIAFIVRVAVLDNVPEVRIIFPPVPNFEEPLIEAPLYN